MDVMKSDGPWRLYFKWPSFPPSHCRPPRVNPPTYGHYSFLKMLNETPNIHRPCNVLYSRSKPKLIIAQDAADIDSSFPPE